MVEIAKQVGMGFGTQPPARGMSKGKQIAQAQAAAKMAPITVPQPPWDDADETGLVDISQHQGEAT